jgi:hypothetical protein
MILEDIHQRMNLYFKLTTEFKTVFWYEKKFPFNY